MKSLLFFLVVVFFGTQGFAQPTIKKNKAVNTYVVTSAGDESDSDLSDGIFSPQTFRSAMENANNSPGLDIITFSGVTVIQPTNIYLGLTEQVIIDGSLPDGSRVVLDGSLLGFNLTVGLIIGINADFSVIENLSIINFSGGAILATGDDIDIENCFIGTSDGVTAAPNGDPDTPQSSPAIFVKGDRTSVHNNLISGNRGYGIRIDAPSDTSEITITNNTIGLDSSGTNPLGNVLDGIRSDEGAPFINGNVISDNGGTGVTVLGSSTKQIEIEDNAIGVDETGTVALGNDGSGILANRDNVIIKGNVISDNLNGIVSQGFGNVIKDNFIGTDITGTMDFGNQFRGVELNGENSTLGGTSVTDRNLISGNDREGVKVSSDDNLIQNNFIGLNASGNTALPNGREGLELLIGSSGNIIKKNVISGNERDGIELFGENAVITIEKNFIGTDSTGSIKIPNLESGITVFNAHGLDIGGDFPEDGNVISGNGLYGIFSGVTSTKPDTLEGINIKNNKIGVDVTGTKALGNTSVGIWIEDNRSEIQTNVVSANFSGIRVNGENNEIYGNKVGTDITGIVDLGNLNQGIELRADSNQVGNVLVPNAINVISGNGTIGIQVNSEENIISGNYIGTDVTGTVDIGNDGDGVEFILFGKNSEVSSNLISGNGGEGIDMFNGNTGIKILANYIGTDITGTIDLGNDASGIDIHNGDDIIIGSPTDDTGNVLSGNGEYGISITGQNTNTPLKGIKIQNNYIGTEEDGMGDIPNTDGGIFISEGKKIAIGGEFDSEESNVISGNNDAGIQILDQDTANSLIPDSISILGNWIGVEIDGSSLGNDDDGIRIETGSNISIGGDSLKFKNIIANNEGDGINIAGGDKVILGVNEIFENDELGIDLAGDGVTMNDTDDSDAGPNGLLNFPEITEARYNEDVELLTIFGRLDVSPEVKDYIIDLYYNDACNPSGFGDAQFFLGTIEATTDASGFFQFMKEFTLEKTKLVDINDGIGVTAINTSLEIGSSEISQCFLIGDSLQAKPDLVLTKTDSLETVEGSDVAAMFTYTVTVKNIGQVVANDVAIMDSIPEVLILGTVTTTDGTISLTDNILSVELDSLASGDSVIVRIPVETDMQGMVINIASVSTPDMESNLSNNTASDTTEVMVIVSNEPNEELPTEYKISQNYPNPFNPSTTISYSVPEAGFVELSIFNILGMKVETLVMENKSPGVYEVRWNASAYSSNVYFYRFKAGDYISTKKMTLIK